jgi:hypothetical protein
MLLFELTELATSVDRLLAALADGGASSGTSGDGGGGGGAAASEPSCEGGSGCRWWRR